MFSGRTTTTIQAPAHGPLDYNSLRPSFATLAPLFGLTMISLIPIGLGALFVYWAMPLSTGLQLISAVVGGLLIVAGARFFWPLSADIPDAIKQYHAMVYAWHSAELDKYQSSDGMITSQQMSEWSYTERDMRHVALAVLWLILEQPRSLSIERLTKGPMQLNIGHRAFKLVDMTQDGAAGFLDLCARAGVINGRGPRTAGTIAILDSRQAAQKILAEASRNPAMFGSDDGN